MPTGYTAELEDMDFDIKRWLIETIPRAFGALVMLREEGNLSEDSIIDALEKNIKDSYHVEAVVNLKKELKEKETWDGERWQEVLDSVISSAKEENTKAVHEIEQKQNKYVPVVDLLKALCSIAPNDDFKNMITFAGDQLDMVRNEFDPESVYQVSIPTCAWNEYRLGVLANLRERIEWNAAEADKEQARERERLQFYLDWVSFVRTVLPDL